MFNKLTVIFLLLTNISSAQNKPQPTRFDKFVNNPKIEWAAYASDTFNFDNADLNNLLLNRLTKNEIKASLPIESRTIQANKIIFIPKDSVKLIFNTNIDTSRFNLTEVTQILYIENGKLKSYIPWVTPTLPVFLSTGKYIGETFYFNTAYNFKYNCKPRKNNKLILLGRTKKMINLDPSQPTDKLKEMYGNNLLKILWPRVLKNEIEAFSPDGNRKLKPEELNITLTYDQPVITPIYDSTSRSTVLKYNIVADPIDTKRFTDVQLIKDWYYDYKKNKVFSDIKEMVLYLSKFNKTEDKEPVPVLKLVFK